MALTAIEVKGAKSTDKSYKLSDEKGMYLYVHTNGGKYWRLDYSFAGKRKTLALGVYPDVSLVDARDRRDTARKQLANGIDPSAAKQGQKAAVIALAANSFELVAREWFGKFSKVWSESHSKTVKGRLENDVYPWIGTRPIGEIEAPELLTVLRRIESRGALSSAHTVNAVCGQIFRYAIATNRAKRDPSADLKGALTPHRIRQLAALTDEVKIGKFLRDIDGYKGTFIVRCAFQLAPLVFLRPIELTKAEWAEIDLDHAQWDIPAERMKKRKPHIVPLSTQAVEIFREIHPLTGSGKYVFPSISTTTKPMARNTLLAAIRSLGYAPEDMTAHGFRHMASTLLNEQQVFSSDAIEMQLAHSAGGVRGTYNKAKYLPERQRMMQTWADYLDGLRKGADVINLNQNCA